MGRALNGFPQQRLVQLRVSINLHLRPNIMLKNVRSMIYSTNSVSSRRGLLRKICGLVADWINYPSNSIRSECEIEEREKRNLICARFYWISRTTREQVVGWLLPARRRGLIETWSAETASYEADSINRLSEAKLTWSHFFLSCDTSLKIKSERMSWRNDFLVVALTQIARLMFAHMEWLAFCNEIKSNLDGKFYANWCEFFMLN